jgi:hypothetical protein
MIRHRKKCAIVNLDIRDIVLGIDLGDESITSLRSNVDQYFSKFMERSNENNFVEQLSCVEKVKVSKKNHSDFQKKSRFIYCQWILNY